MIKSLERFDPREAAGLLARVALSLGHGRSPASISAEDEGFRASLLEEARSRLGLARGDESPEAVEKIAEFLDEESDRLLSPPDTMAALRRMAKRGDLPSDLYEINVVQNVVDIYGKYYSLEKDIIEATVKDPDDEQHFGTARHPYNPVLISIFLKSFRTKWPLKDFAMIVAGQRDGFKLHVHQAWRIYPSIVKLSGAKSPVDWLRRFAETFGVDIDVEGKLGPFLLFSDNPGPATLQWKTEDRSTIIISRFTQGNPDTGRVQSALIVAINITKYLSFLKDLRVKREDMLEDPRQNVNTQATI